MIRFIIKRARARRHLTLLQQAGLALLDVLLGVAIFVLIAVIAFQSTGIFRERAYMTAATSDVRQVATGILAVQTGPGSSGGFGYTLAATTPSLTEVPTGVLTPEQLSGLGVNLSHGGVAVVNHVEEGYDACVQNASAFAWWRAAASAVVEVGYVKDGKTCATTSEATPDVPVIPVNPDDGELPVGVGEHGTPIPADIVMVLDRTASLTDFEIDTMKRGVLDALGQLDPAYHRVALGTIHKSRTTRFTHASDVREDFNISGWNGEGDTDGDGICRTEATRQRAFSGASAASTRAEGAWVPVGFSTDYLNTDGTLNDGSALVDGVSCMGAAAPGEYGTHLAAAMKGAAKHLLEHGRQGAEKVILFMTDGMPDEMGEATSAASLSLDDDGFISAGPSILAPFASNPLSGTAGCENLGHVATSAKDAGITIVTIAHGEAARSGCERHINYAGEPLVADVLAAVASPHPMTGEPSAAGDCSTPGGIAEENADGDLFFCGADTNFLAEVFGDASVQIGYEQ